eukprot:CAMPEP_0194750204 /NCGR_PEP_ID=MMETSP0323_2-20130528/4258_1 /TAXON_ID=2866 ORGANISM="Crypthecodinium cohnii, Strain Seligo" /NCGR_SAMPLE_ID=MMETSP0323_2 /ASSEMBLY_ACC=CAM_ASM_000346 /LENGTH=154 /DNA_ID=CAMNT_0039665739 /DNA_START=112 /DNA_END=575 /DNA_ORIENTATION=-
MVAGSFKQENVCFSIWRVSRMIVAAADATPLRVLAKPTCQDQDLVSLPAGVTAEDLLQDSGVQRAIRQQVLGALVLTDSFNDPNNFDWNAFEEDITLFSVVIVDDQNAQAAKRRVMFNSTLTITDPLLVAALQSLPRSWLAGASVSSKMFIMEA